MGGRVIEIESASAWADAHGEAKNSGRMIVVDFTATWCGPCRMISPIFEEYSEIYTNLMFCKVDVDKVEDVAGECGVSAMPTFQVYKDGEKIEELVGASKDRLQQMIVKYNDTN